MFGFMLEDEKYSVEMILFFHFVCNYLNKFEDNLNPSWLSSSIIKEKRKNILCTKKREKRTIFCFCSKNNLNRT
jgi:hypothetical protein